MKHFLLKTVIVLFLLSSALELCAQKILVINTYNPTFPWTSFFNLELRQIAEQSGGKVELFFEDLDITRFGDEEHQKNFAGYLSVKYADYPIDGIIGNSDQACTFIETHCNFAPFIPKAYYTSNLEYASKNTLCLDFEYKEVIDKTWKFITNLQPKASSVFIIAGEYNITNTIYTEFLKTVPSTINVKLFMDFTFKELKDTLASLPETTAVFFIPVTQDHEGTSIFPKQLLTEIALISTAPIYSCWETLIGTGCIGGEMLSAQKTAQELLGGLQTYLEKGKFDSSYTISQTVADWTAVRKYELSTDVIPSDARIVNKPDPFYITHKKEILIIANVVLVAFFLFLLTGIILIGTAYQKIRKINKELAEARQKAEKLSLYDTLSGLYNRRGIEPMITYEMNRKKRFGSPVSLLIVDIDHFKDVNDTYGHDIGDIVLKQIAHTLQTNRRSTDIPARWGGEEFITLLSDTKESQAIMIAERLRTACSNLVFNECRSVTVSVGVAEFQNDETFESWFKRADSALYTAKTTGRNKTAAASGMDIATAEKQSGNELLLLNLTWKDDYQIGVKSIDQQHQNLFIILNKLINSIINNDQKEKIDAILKQLETDSKRHFTDEENYLEKKSCPIIERHKKEHIRLINQLHINAEAFEDKSISAYEFISFLCCDLISKHILEEDKLSFDSIRP